MGIGESLPRGLYWERLPPESESQTSSPWKIVIEKCIKAESNPMMRPFSPKYPPLPPKYRHPPSSLLVHSHLGGVTLPMSAMHPPSIYFLSWYPHCLLCSHFPFQCSIIPLLLIPLFHLCHYFYYANIPSLFPIFPSLYSLHFIMPTYSFLLPPTPAWTPCSP